MTNLRQRGWDIPGGHLEPGETPEAAMRREVMEEAGAVLGDVQLLGYQRIRLLGTVPIGYRYPRVAGQQLAGGCKFLTRYSRDYPTINNARCLPTATNIHLTTLHGLKVSVDRGIGSVISGAIVHAAREAGGTIIAVETAFDLAAGRLILIL